MPKPSKLDDILEANLINALRAGATITMATQAFNVGNTTFYTWMHSEAPRYRAFQAKVARARAEAAVEAVGQVRLHGREDWRAAAWFLEKSFPAEFGNKVKAEISGPEGGPIVVEGKVYTLDLTRLPPAAVQAIVEQMEEEADDSDTGDRKRLRGPRPDPSTGTE